MSRLIDYGWIASAPVRFLGVVAVCLIGGLYYGVLSVRPMWRDLQRWHDLRQS